MASPSVKEKQPPRITGTTKRMNDEKQALRDAVSRPTRPAVPDDSNNVQTYKNWQPGQLRPFIGVHVFNMEKPMNGLCGGPAKAVGGKLNAISYSPKMNSQKIIGKNGWSR